MNDKVGFDFSTNTIKDQFNFETKLVLEIKKSIQESIENRNDYKIKNFPIYDDFTDKLIDRNNCDHYDKFIWESLKKSYLDYKNNKIYNKEIYLPTAGKKQFKINEIEVQKIFESNPTNFKNLIEKLFEALINQINFGEIESLRRGFYIISLEFIQVV